MGDEMRPVPTVNSETAPFWEGVAAGRFVIQRCDACGAVQHYYRPFCASCWSDAVMDVPVSGAGRVWSASVIWRNKAPGFAERVPYVVAVVELDEGVRVFGNIEMEDVKDVPVGTVVDLIMPKSAEGRKDALPAFVIREG